MIGLQVKLTILGEYDVASTTIVGILISSIVFTVDTSAQLLILYRDISFRFVSPSLLFSLFNLFTARISSILVSTHVGFGFDISEKSH